MEPLPGLVNEVLAGLAAEPAAGIVYGDYIILVGPGDEARRTLLAHESDLSEWSGIGYVAGMRRDAGISIVSPFCSRRSRKPGFNARGMRERRRLHLPVQPHQRFAARHQH